jgi:DNA invertase Pin-like site-specific DNA recombinase
LDRQIAALRAQRCDAIYREKASGRTVKGRPELEKAIDQLAAGDIFILAEWDRCTRSMQDGVAIIERVHARGALVRVLDRDYLDLTKPINRGILAFLSALEPSGSTDAACAVRQSIRARSRWHTPDRSRHG